MVMDEETFRGEGESGDTLHVVVPSGLPTRFRITVVNPGMGEMADGRIVDEETDITMSRSEAARLARFLFAYAREHV